LPHLIKYLDALAGYKFDEGSEFFPPSNLEITSIDVGNLADNVIPGSGSAKFNIRFNDAWNGESLAKKVREILNKAGMDYQVEFTRGAESLITEAGGWAEMVSDCVTEITGIKPELSTKGGTSDARFIQKYCPVVEFGLTNTSAHQIDEYLIIEE